MIGKKAREIIMTSASFYVGYDLYHLFLHVCVCLSSLIFFNVSRVLTPDLALLHQTFGMVSMLVLGKFFLKYQDSME